MCEITTKSNKEEKLSNCQNREKIGKITKAIVCFNDY